MWDTKRDVGNKIQQDISNTASVPGVLWGGYCSEWVNNSHALKSTFLDYREYQAILELLELFK